VKTAAAASPALLTPDVVKALLPVIRTSQGGKTLECVCRLCGKGLSIPFVAVIRNFDDLYIHPRCFVRGRKKTFTGNGASHFMTATGCTGRAGWTFSTPKDAGIAALGFEIVDTVSSGSGKLSKEDLVGFVTDLTIGARLPLYFVDKEPVQQFIARLLRLDHHGPNFVCFMAYSKSC
jgi:hypothetical protein